MASPSTESDRTLLGQTRIALPGLGGVGGGHARVLAGMGVGAFNLADLDTFELANFNRQDGASMHTVGRPKVEVAAEIIRTCNPSAAVTSFPKGIHSKNINAFLDGVDVVVDGLEFFAIEVRRMLYFAARARRIPVVHAGPIGFGATLLVFLPDGPSFDEYFRMEEGMTRAELLAAHALGHARGFQSDVDPARVNFQGRTGPALATACTLCSALAGMEVLRLVRGERPMAAAPQGLYFDPWRNRVLRLRPRPSLTRSFRGRLLKWLVFRRFTGLREMHERELVERRGTSLGARCTHKSLFRKPPHPTLSRKGRGGTTAAF